MSRSDGRFEHDRWPWKLRHSFGDFWVLVDANDGYVSDACVEGSGEEFRDMARALRGRWKTSHKRCAVGIDDKGLRFYSPRNTQGCSAYLELSKADELAAIIDAVLDAGAPEDE